MKDYSLSRLSSSLTISSLPTFFVVTFLLFVALLSFGVQMASAAPGDDCDSGNLIQNGGFEMTDHRTGTYYGVYLDLLATSYKQNDVFTALPGTTGDAWVTSSGQGIEVIYGPESWKNTNPHSGDIRVELDSMDNSSMTQTVSLEGGNYNISFWYQPRNELPDDNTIEVYVDGVFVGEADGIGDSSIDDWTQYVIELSGVTPGSHDITFQAAGTSNGAGGILDDVSLECRMTTGELTIIKTVINDDGDTSVASDFTLSVSGVNPSDTSVTGNEAGVTITLEAGDYSVTEDDSIGYDVSYSADCNGTMAIGDEKTCIVTNDDQPLPELTVAVHMINDNGRNAVPSDVTVQVTGTNVSPSTFDGDDAGTPVTLDPGAFDVQSSALSGYVVTLGNGCQGTMARGDILDCAITYDDQPISRGGGGGGGSTGGIGGGTTTGGGSTTDPGTTSDPGTSTDTSSTDATGTTGGDSTGSPQVLGFTDEQATTDTTATMVSVNPVTNPTPQVLGYVSTPTLPRTGMPVPLLILGLVLTLMSMGALLKRTST